LCVGYADGPRGGGGLYLHSKPFYKAKVYFADGRVVDRKWWDEDVEQPSPAPTSTPWFGSGTPKPEKPKNKP
jgi:hypothetical protein